MNLVRAELERLAARRFVQLMLVLLAVAFAVTVATTLAGSHQPTAAELQQANWQVDQIKRENSSFYQECLRTDRGGRPGYPEDKFPADCEEILTWSQPDPLDYLYGVFVFERQITPLVWFLVAFLGLFGFLVGASYIGAEWSSGGMMNLLLWRPKRRTVLLTKLGVLTGATLTVTVLLGALWTVAFWVIGRYDGVTGKVTSGVWQSYGLTGLRGIGLVLMVTAIAFGLASFGRHTAMALGVAIGVGVIAEIGLRIAFGTTGVAFGERFIPSTYVLAWFLKKLTLSDWNSCRFAQGTCNPAEMVVTWQQSGLVFGAVTVVVLAAAFWAIRRRDVV